ncbi:anti-sigma factor family protein [Ensifer soli]|uniref:anti-sigma factor family protein n=1 Tax=Ciceribacter sp. sgz301302 TaxID=3342379 RepID=UPI0035B7334A
MQSTQGLALEVRLSAYLDGEVNEAEKTELAQMIATDEDARRIYETLQAGSAFGNAAFEDFLHDPVPLALVRRIKQGPGITPKTERVTAAVARPVRRKLWPKALAASLALVAAGGVAGFLIGATRGDGAGPAQVAQTRNWLDDVADYHRIYASQTRRRLVEAPASEKADIEPWLAASVGVPFRVPDLSAQGLTFEGARLLVAASKPVAQLLYRDVDGEIFGICFVKSAGADTDGISESIRDEFALLSWRRAGAAYVVIGPSSDVKLEALARAVEAEI